MRVLHVIASLQDGGAEAVLYRLCRALPDVEHVVLSLQSGGKYVELLRQSGVEVRELGWRRGSATVTAWPRLTGTIKEIAPNVIQTWMYQGDFLGGLAARAAGVEAVCWGIHNTTLKFGSSKLATIVLARLCAALSHFLPKRIVSCANAAARYHARLGYSRKKMAVINNGYDIEQFSPNDRARTEMRDAVGGDKTVPWLALVGRYDPQKDHKTLLDALQLLRARGRTFYCLLVGIGADQANEDLAKDIRSRGLEACVHAHGPTSNVPAIMNAIDLNVLSSAYGEAFPNVLAEAMACGVPCVTTDVGDSSLIVRDTGWVVSPRNPVALANKIEEALSEWSRAPASWQARKERARDSIVSRYSEEKMAASYADIWRSCAS